MLKALEAASYHIKRMGIDFEYGDVVRERLVEPAKIESFTSRVQNLVAPLNELRYITEGASKQLAEEAFETLAKGRKTILKLTKKAGTTNADLEAAVQDLHTKLDDLVYVLREEIELKGYVEFGGFPLAPEVLQTVASKFSATRDVTVFQNHMGRGEGLLAFKERMNTNHSVTAYGVEEDLGKCREAKSAGIDRIAKKGLMKVSNDVFDIVINPIPVVQHFEGMFSTRPPEELDFTYMLHRRLARSGGYFIFTLPAYRIAQFMGRLNRSMVIVGKPYRVDDDMSTVLFVCRNTRLRNAAELKQQNLLLRRAMLEYEKLPHYTEMEPISITDRRVEHPSVFRPFFIDADDINEAFVGSRTTADSIAEKYKPSEDVIDLERPLQEYREGHLPAVAASGAVNGIYDTDRLKEIMDLDIDYSNLYLTRIRRQNVVEEQEELDSKGNKVRLISEKKRNTIISKLLKTNGEIVTLLETNS